MVSVKVYVNDEEMFVYGSAAEPASVPFAVKADAPADVIDEAKLSGIDPATLALLLELGRLGLKLLMQWLEKRKARRAG